MAQNKKSSETPQKKQTKGRLRPALTPEARELQLVDLATNLAAQQLMDGTASSQVITHFLKLGTTRAQLEKEKLAKETELLKAKTAVLESQENMEKMYAEAISAMKRYSGYSGDDDEDCYEDQDL